MSPSRAERLLRERASAQQDERASRAAFELVLRERARTRWRRRAKGVLLAAAAVLVTGWLWRPLTAPPERPSIRIALLSETGLDLSLDGSLRGGAARPPFPTRVLVEVAAETGGFARVLLFDATGALHTADSVLEPDRAVLAPIDLGAGAPGDAGGELDWIVVASSSRADLERPELSASPLPAAGAERRAALEALVERLASVDGLAVQARHLVVEAR